MYTENFPIDKKNSHTEKKRKEITNNTRIKIQQSLWNERIQKKRWINTDAIPFVLNLSYCIKRFFQINMFVKYKWAISRIYENNQKNPTKLA